MFPSNHLVAAQAREPGSKKGERSEPPPKIYYLTVSWEGHVISSFVCLVTDDKVRKLKQRNMGGALFY